MNSLKKFSLLILVSFTAVVFISCGDADVIPPKNSGEFTTTNLKPLDKDVDGVYGVWVSLETSFDHGDAAYKSLGRFNITISGALVDTSVNQNTFSLNVSGIADINDIEDAIITIEPPGDNDTIPSNIRILGAPKEIQSGALVFNLSMSSADVLGGIASQFPNDSAKFVLAAPTLGDTNQFYRGLWFSLDARNPVPGLTLASIPDTMDWVYQAWVFDRRNVDWKYDMGRFNSPNQQDNNQQCEQNPPDSVWQIPGHDWIMANCPGASLPDILSLDNSNYDIVITLEPRFEQGLALSKPFYIQLFKVSKTQGQPYGTVFPLINTTPTNIPSGFMRLVVNR